MAKLNIRNRNKDKVDKNGKPKAANWEYRFEAAKVDGKRKHISKAGFRTQKEAYNAGTKALAEYNHAGLTFEPSEMSYSDYLDYWFDNYVKTSCKYNTQTAYITIIENHLKPALGMFKLKALSPMQIQEYVNQKFTTGLKKTTLKNIMAVLSGSLKYAVVPAQLIKSSPAEYITYPSLQKERSEKNRTVISIEQFNIIMDRFEKGNPFRYALLIGFYTGMRIGEVFALTWDDINFEEGIIDVNKLVYKRTYGMDVRKAKSKGKKEENASWYFGDTKTKASTRKIKVGKALLSELREYKTMQLKNEISYGEYYTHVVKKEEKDEKGNTIYRLIEVEKSVPVALPEANLVMRKENGEYSSTDSFKYAARVIHYDLNIPEFNFHSLRHTHATKLIESGISPKAVQTRLGHEKIETTLQTYVHNTEKMEQAAVDAFEEIMSTNKDLCPPKQA